MKMIIFVCSLREDANYIIQNHFLLFDCKTIFHEHLQLETCSPKPRAEAIISANILIAVATSIEKNNGEIALHWYCLYYNFYSLPIFNLYIYTENW